MSQVLCINANFSPERLAFFKQNNIVLPKEDKIYQVRDIITHTAIGKKGLLLEEIRNRKVEQEHPVLGKYFMEITWDVNRFANLDGTALNLSEINKIKSKV